MSDNPTFSYTNRDYESSRKEGLARIPMLSRGQYTDLNATDPGVIILDYVHALVDMINFYQDHQALETFLPTAKERKNIFRLAEQLSYQVISAKGATCSATFTSNLLYDHPIRIPKHTKLSTSTGIGYLTSEDAYLPANTPSVTVLCEQGIISNVTYQGTGISRFSENGTMENQSILLYENNIDTDSIVVKDNLGRVWERVDYIIFTTSSDRAYQVKLNSDDTVTILFGDGERGIVPKENEIFTVEYKVTKAEEGSIGAGLLTIVEDDILDNGQYVNFSLNNSNPSIGGSSIQSSREIRDLAPGVIKSQYRAVTLRDFENLAKIVDGVNDAKAYDMNTNETLLHHEVLVLIVPESQASSQLLKDKVYDFLYQRSIPPTNLKVMTPSSVVVNISIEVRKIDTATVGEVEYEVRNSINDYFKENSNAIGENFYPSVVLARVSNLKSVRYVTTMTPSSVIEITDFSVATLGTLDITVV